MTEVSDLIKAGMRAWLAKEGAPVKYEETWWDEDDPWYAKQEKPVSTYGWQDFDATYHILGEEKKRLGGPCEWVIPEGAKLKEVSYSQFDGTFTGNKEEVGVNAYGVSCKCGKYTGVTLRITATLGDAIQSVLGYDPTKEMTL